MLLATCLPGGRVPARRFSRGRRVAVCASASSFSVKAPVRFGEALRVVGSLPELGSWDVSKAPQLSWSDGDVWSAQVVLPEGAAGAAFKFVVVRDGQSPQWEEGADRTLSENGAVSAVFNDQAPPKQSKSRKHAPQTDAQQPSDAAAAAPQPAEPLVLATVGEEGRWQGGQVAFMQSNEHSGNRRGAWKTEGLSGAAKALVEGDKRAGSWLQKLEVVAELVGAERSQALDELATSAVYLQWVSTGVISCSESGVHQRPNRAAMVGRGVFINLERALGDSYGNPGVSELPRLAARRVLPWLPSFSGAFTCAVPLTRIRDIAHRNDIPHDVKQQIKHTIQNKLHRNAGPEDLVATEAMLARVTAVPGEFNADFVSEFRLFHAELKDFFNARTAFERLDEVESGLDDSGRTQVAQLRGAKAALDGATEASLLAWAAEAQSTAVARERELVLSTLHATTSARALLLRNLSSGLRNDAPDAALAHRQSVRSCEGALEEYAFVLASRATGTLEREAALGARFAWGPALTAAVLMTRQLGLSGFRTAECAAVEAGLEESRSDPGVGSDAARTLRCAAACARARRLAEAHAGALMECFAQRAAALGEGLGAPPAVSRTYGEAAVRAAPSFALSNLLSLLLRACGECTGGDGSETVVGGVATGTLTQLPRLGPGGLPQGTGPAVLLLGAADGDEEVSGCGQGGGGQGVAGVLLLQQLPHLSHLAVRARQERVVLATCAQEAPVAAQARKLLGKRVVLTARPEGGVTLREATPADEQAAAASYPQASSRPAWTSTRPSAGAVERVKAACLLPLDQATPPSCGAKAATCGQLLRIAQRVSEAQPEAAFSAPNGVVLPFGCMEAALSDSGAFQRYEQLLHLLQTAPVDGGALDGACTDMQALVAATRPQDKLMQAVAAALPGGGRCVVRSSSNVEDLEGLSGAGLYESVAGVRLDDTSALGEAVAHVWASLHTRRAVLARRAAGLAQSAAAMAVLVQCQAAVSTAFVLHTADPGRPEALLAELCAGQGETLASGAVGSGWRLQVERDGKVRTLAFANFSTQLVAPPGDGPGMLAVPVDYSRQPLSSDGDYRAKLGARLGAVGRALQAELGGAPQDVEGGLVGDQLVVVQSRPQPSA